MCQFLKIFKYFDGSRSVNEVICHGIPDDRALEEGDIVNLDITVYQKGYHGDLNETICVGKVADSSKFLVNLLIIHLNK